MKTTAVVLNWRQPHETIAALSSLRDTGVDAIVVDNASGDGSVDAIRDAYPGVVMIENGVNAGYAGGNNTGIRLALDRGTDAVLVLNSDVVVEPGALDLLTQALLDHPEWGIAAPVSLCRDDPSIVDFYRATVDLDHLAVHAQGRDEPLGELGDCETDYATGSAMLIRRSLIEEIGLFDERFFLVWEDVDFGVRARAAGSRIGVVARARVHHGRSVSFGGEATPMYQYFFVRNSFLIVANHLRGVRRARTLRAISRRYRGWISQPQTSQPVARAIELGLAHGRARAFGPPPKAAEFDVPVSPGS
ncbi:MAG: glycosyltransferase family 2 protein [Actinomycetota bacterium]